MGERCRVAFVLLYFSEANLMVLDEPTNFLDIPTREQIEDALIRYPGSLVMVSHDRYSLKKVTNRVILLKDGQMAYYYPGSYEEFQNYLHKRTNRPVDREMENQMLSLQLKLAQLMAQEEPEEADNRKAFYANIDKVKKELNKLRSES